MQVLNNGDMLEIKLQCAMASTFGGCLSWRLSVLLKVVLMCSMIDLEVYKKEKVFDGSVGRLDASGNFARHSIQTIELLTVCVYLQ